MELIPPNPTEHAITKDDMPMSKADSPFELSLTQSLHLERLKRDVAVANPDDLREMTVMLASQLMIKSNICNALMRGKF